MVSNQKWLQVFTEFIKYMRIDSKEVAAVDSRGSPLNLWASQRILLEEICKGLDKGIRTFNILKARQLGISTFSLAIDIFWLAMHPGTLGCLVTESEGNRDVFRNTIRRYIENFPKGFFGKSFGIMKGQDNRNFMGFSNGSRLDFLIAGTRKKENWAEGRGYAFAHLTEVAKYGSAAGLASFRETLADNHPNRLFIYESTANGFNHWYNMWEEAKRDTHTKKAIFIGWWSKDINKIEKADPRYEIYGQEPADEEEQELIDIVKDRYDYKITHEQLAWYRWRNSDQSSAASDIHQNLPWTEQQAFVLSGISFFQPRSLQKDYERILNPENPIEFRGFRYWLGNDFQQGRMEQIIDADRINEVELRIWEEPRPDAQYLIGCDPAFGRNDWKDRHAVSVWRAYSDKLVQVAEYADNNVETRQAAWVLAFLAGTYKNCIVNIELTGGPGKAVMVELDQLRDRLRSGMFQAKSDRNWDDFLANASWYLYHRPDSFGAGYAKGFVSSFESKSYMCNSMRDSYSSECLVINSKPLIEEMLKVIQDGSSIGAPEPAKDDRVFAAMLANLAWKEWIRPRMVQEGYTYEKASAKESGETSWGNDIVNKMVFDYFKFQEEMSETIDTRPRWLVDRGLA